MRSSRTPITLSPVARLLMGLFSGMSGGAGIAISQYLGDSYGLRHPAMMIGISIVAPVLLVLFVNLLFHLRARTKTARRWPTVLLAGILLVEIPIYLCWMIYVFRPCSWLDLPRRLNGCAAVTAFSQQEFGLFRYADTNAGDLITSEDRLLGWLADPSLSPLSDENPPIAVSPTAQLVAFARDDGTVELRQLTTGAIYAQLPTASKEISDLTFTPDGQSLLVANGSPELQLWNIRTQTRLATLTDQIEVRQSASSPDGVWLATVGDGKLRVWDWRRRTPGYTLSNAASVQSIAFSPDSQYLASGDWDGQIRLWRVSDGTLLQQIQAYERGSVDRLVFTPDSQTLISSGGNQARSIRLWSVASGTLVRTFDQRYAPTLAISVDGRSLYAAGVDWLYRWRLP